MMFALDENREAVQARPKRRALCPACKTEVLAKCGEIMVWHWAHLKGSECFFSGVETQWHLDWKAAFHALGAAVEVRLEKGGRVKYADVVVGTGFRRTVIELQTSAISVEELRDREQFYDRMAWIFDCRDADISLRDRERYHSFRWKHARKTVGYAEKPVFLDVQYVPVWDPYTAGFRLVNSQDPEFHIRAPYQKKALLQLRKIDIEAPCGGWGLLRPRDPKFFLGWR
jgi:Competence protein